MRFIRLSEVCTINMGQSPDSTNYNDAGNGLPFFQGNADFGDKYPVTRVWCNEPTKIAHAEDILISVRAPIGAMNYAKEKCCIGRGLAAITPDKKRVSPEFIFWLLKGKNAELNSKGTGSTFKAISRKVLEEVLVPDISLEQQIAYASHLETVYAIMKSRQRQLHALDTLIKARFVEMFGDEPQFASAPLDNSVEEMFIGPFGSSLKNECFVPAEDGFCIVYEQKHAIRKTMDVDTRYVDKKKFHELQRFTVLGGDIIVSCRGTIGETFIVPDDAPIGIMHPSIMKIRLKSTTYNRVFFNHLLQTVLKRHEDEANGSGVKMAITATALGQESFIIPSMTLQNQFAVFVSKVDKSKSVVQQALVQDQLLFDSLMQKYFG